MEAASTARRSVLHSAERLRSLSETERDMIRLANTDGFGRWLEQMHAVGGCAHPIYLAGHSIVRDAHSGEVLRHYTTHNEPQGVLAVRCRNRRETQCAPCSRLHSGDTFQLVRAGLVGGKGTPGRVTDHPRLFVTLTAPSFGPVHHTNPDAGRCHPRRHGGTLRARAAPGLRPAARRDRHSAWTAALRGLLRLPRACPVARPCRSAVGPHHAHHPATPRHCRGPHANRARQAPARELRQGR